MRLTQRGAVGPCGRAGSEGPSPEGSIMQARFRIASKAVICMDRPRATITRLYAELLAVRGLSIRR